MWAKEDAAASNAAHGGCDNLPKLQRSLSEAIIVGVARARDMGHPTALLRRRELHLR